MSIGLKVTIRLELTKANLDPASPSDFLHQIGRVNGVNLLGNDAELLVTAAYPQIDAGIAFENIRKALQSRYRLPGYILFYKDLQRGAVSAPSNDRH